MLTLVKPFSFVWYVIPPLKTGAFFDSTRDLFLQVEDEKNSSKTGVCVSNGFYWPQYSPNGGVQWLLPKPWTPSIGWCVRYGTGAPQQPSKWPAELIHCLLLFALLLPWLPLRRYGASSALGNTVCTAPTRLHGHWNGPLWRCIRFLPPLFLLAIIVAKDNVMVH